MSLLRAAWLVPLALSLGACRTDTTKPDDTTPPAACSTGDDCTSGLCEQSECVVEQQLPCSDEAPQNASSEVVEETVSFSDADGWADPGVCDWVCDADFTDDGAGACVDSKQLPCTDASPANASATLADVTVTYTDADGWASPAECAWNCDADYADDGAGACVNTMLASCTDASPSNATATLADVSVTYTDAGGWTTPAECAWSCNADYADDGAGACVNTMLASCTDASPANAAATLADVTITYTDAVGWTTPAECAWSCNVDYVDEGGVCINNKQVSCTDSSPANASATIVPVPVSYTDAGGWTAPADCAWSCDADYVDEGGVCLNSKQVSCTDNAPVNASATIVPVPVSYTDAGGWTAPADCAWSCNADYVDDGAGVCINSKQVSCVDSSPNNATAVVADVPITYTDAGGWATPADCAWSCNADYVDDGAGVCINSKQVSCVDSSPNNATAVVADVPITYTDAVGWATPADCTWSCDANYVEESLACYLGPLGWQLGDVVITELHTNPVLDPAGANCSDTNGEYVEIYNATAVPLALAGLTIGDASGAQSVHPGGELLAPDSYAVFGRSGNCFGLTLSDTFSFQLNNSGDSITLGDGTRVLDVVDWRSWYTTSLAGISFNLDPTAYGPNVVDADINNDAESNWCPSTEAIPDGVNIGIGDLGTPGQPNPVCIPSGSSPVDAARSCKDIFDAGLSTGDGLYWLDLTGGDNADAFQTQCDMTNGGWTQVVRILGDSLAHADQPAALMDWANPALPAKLSDADISALNTVGYWRYSCGASYQAYVQNAENTWISDRTNNFDWSIDRGLDGVFECAGNRPGYVFSDYPACNVGHTDYAAAGGGAEGYGCYNTNEGWNLDGELWAK